MNNSTKNLELFVKCNSKEITQDSFYRNTEMSFEYFTRTYNKDCMKVWREYIKNSSKKRKQEEKQLEIDSKLAIKQRKLEELKQTQQAIRISTKQFPIAIKQLAEMHVMVSLGEFSSENFCKAFHVRFRDEAKKAKNRRSLRGDFGWDSIDWSKVEASPLLSQLLV